MVVVVLCWWLLWQCVGGCCGSVLIDCCSILLMVVVAVCWWLLWQCVYGRCGIVLVVVVAVC